MIFLGDFPAWFPCIWLNVFCQHVIVGSWVVLWWMPNQRWLFDQECRIHSELEERKEQTCRIQIRPVSILSRIRFFDPGSSECSWFLHAQQTCHKHLLLVLLHEHLSQTGSILRPIFVVQVDHHHQYPWHRIHPNLPSHLYLNVTINGWSDPRFNCIKIRYLPFPKPRPFRLLTLSFSFDTPTKERNRIKNGSKDETKTHHLLHLQTRHHHQLHSVQVLLTW